MSGLNQDRKTQIETQFNTLTFESHYVASPRSPQPSTSPPSVSPPSIAFSRNHSFRLISALSSSRFPVILSEHNHHTIMLSYKHYSAGCDHSVSNPSSSLTPSSSPLPCFRSHLCHRCALRWSPILSLTFDLNRSPQCRHPSLPRCTCVSLLSPMWPSVCVRVRVSVSMSVSMYICSCVWSVT